MLIVLVSAAFPLPSFAPQVSSHLVFSEILFSDLFAVCLLHIEAPLGVDSRQYSLDYVDSLRQYDEGLES